MNNIYDLRLSKEKMYEKPARMFLEQLGAPKVFVELCYKKYLAIHINKSAEMKTHSKIITDNKNQISDIIIETYEKVVGKKLEKPKLVIGNIHCI